MRLLMLGVQGYQRHLLAGTWRHWSNARAAAAAAAAALLNVHASHHPTAAQL
jgi:hypothetical protein